MSERVLKKVLRRFFLEYAKQNDMSVKEARACFVEDYGVHALRGYGIFETVDFPGIHIERIDEMDIYSSDLEAAAQAEKDGIALIPIREIPEEYPYNCYRFIDTPENRAVLQKIGCKSIDFAPLV